MGKSTELNSELFEGLLAIFSADRDEAGRRYEQIRAGLIRFFHFRGCGDAEILADETINRVAFKLDSYDEDRTQRLSSYFYGFATKVLLEHYRHRGREVQISDEDSIVAELLRTADRIDDRSECLQHCLSKLSADEHEMIVEYYGSEGKKKADVRNKLGEKFGYSPGGLYTKIHRIKTEVRVCVENCLKST